MKLAHAVFFLLSACCATIACGDVSKGRKVGGACDYRHIYGRATITEIRVADGKANNCKNAVEVIFSFSPDDPSAAQQYRFADHPDTGRRFRVGAGMNPPRDWARGKGLVKGAVHRCIRSEILKGTCTPVIFTFPDIDTQGWEKACLQ